MIAAIAPACSSWPGGRLDRAEVEAVGLRGDLRAGRAVAAVVTGVVDGHHGLDVLLGDHVVDGVHALDAVVGAGLEDGVLERPQRGPRGGCADHLVALHVRDDRQRRRRAQGLRQREHVTLDLAVDLLVGLRVVEVVADVLGHVDVVAADAAVLVDPLPERLLRLGDRHAERRERALGQVGDGAEVDAPVVLVDRVGARLVRDARRRAARLVVALATATAGGDQCKCREQHSCPA